ncbi:MAG TPA: hypothetical protein VLA72_18700 [Anaerolineales bacterium]|nr:hypothetical protein [Anaerolineales bacterium]
MNTTNRRNFVTLEFALLVVMLGFGLAGRCNIKDGQTITEEVIRALNMSAYEVDNGKTR